MDGTSSGTVPRTVKSPTKDREDTQSREVQDTSLTPVFSQPLPGYTQLIGPHQKHLTRDSSSYLRRGP